jgi:hypothetical protein
MAMKSVALMVALCVLCGPAIAQTSQCQSIPKASDRLACYDRAAPPTGKSRNAATSPAPLPPPELGSSDPLSAENARLDAKINNICRGC